jgi:hypothetical protein
MSSQESAFDQLSRHISFISQGFTEEVYSRILYSLSTNPIACDVWLKQIIEVGDGTHGPEKNSVASTGEASTAPPSPNAE